MAPVYKNILLPSTLDEKWTLLRIKLVGFCFITAFCLIIARAFYIQVLNHETWEKRQKLQVELIKKNVNSSFESPNVLHDTNRNKDIVSKEYISKNPTIHEMQGYFKNNTFDSIMLLLGTVGVIGTFIQICVSIYPIYSDRRTKILLFKRLGQGPYDKETIRKASRNYIRTKCSESNPTIYSEIKESDQTPQYDFFKFIDQFISESTNKFLFVLADSGMGKTTAVLNYYAYNAFKKKRSRSEIQLVPLCLKDSGNFTESVKYKSDTVIIFDGLDEDTSAIKDCNNRIFEIVESTSSFKKVIITCRTQFFLSDQEIPTLTKSEKIGPRNLGEGKYYNFNKIYISPFDDDDVAEYLRKIYPFWKREKRELAFQVIRKIPFLSVRPMLLAYVPEILDKKLNFTTAFDIYDTIVNAWYHRELIDVDINSFQSISEKLAKNIYLKKDIRGMESIPYHELCLLISEFNLEIENWKITGRSLLNRDPVGNFKFSHRSIMEFLFVKRLLNQDTECINIELTDLMKAFLISRTCDEWPLPQETYQRLIKTNFKVDFFTTEGPFITKFRLSELFEKMYLESKWRIDIDISDLIELQDGITWLLKNASLCSIIRDISISLIYDKEMKVIFNRERNDSFWLKKDFKAELIIKHLDKIPSTIFKYFPDREIIGIFAFCQFFGSKIGLDKLEDIINLAQNEIIYDVTSKVPTLRLSAKTETTFS